MKKNIHLILIGSIIVIIAAGLLVTTYVEQRREKKYTFMCYSKDEAVEMFYSNEQLFCDVVNVIESNPDFWEKCRSPWDPITSATIDSPHSDKMNIFSSKERKTISDFFELGPSMIDYDYSKTRIWITFVNENQSGSYSFVYTHYYSTDYYIQKGYCVESLKDGWFFVYKD